MSRVLFSFVVLCLAIGTSADPSPDCVACIGSKKAWAVNKKTCVAYTDVKKGAAVQPWDVVYTAEDCPRQEKEVKCDEATVKQVLGDISKELGKALAAMKAANGDKSKFEAAAKPAQKIADLFFDPKGEKNRAPTDLYYCSFGPYALAGVKNNAEQVHKVLDEISGLVTKTFADELKADTAEYRGVKPKGSSNGAKQKKNGGAPAVAAPAAAPKKLMLLQVESKANTRRWLLGWAANLLNLALACGGFLPVWNGRLTPGHCVPNGPNPGLFVGCTNGVTNSRNWAQAGNCARAMAHNGQPLAYACDWYGGVNCQNNAGNKPAANAPAILGRHNDIVNTCPASAGQGHDCIADGFNKLHLYGGPYDDCVNLQWAVCAAQGGLPNQGGAGVGGIRIVTGPKELDTGYGYTITMDELCTLNAVCGNAALLWNQNAPFNFVCAYNNVIV